MSKWKVGDIVIEMRHEWRQDVVYTPRRVSKVGRKYFYLDFENQDWRNETKYLIEDGIEKADYSTSTRVFANVDELREHLIPQHAYPALKNKGLRLDHFSILSTKQLLGLCRVMECYEDVENSLKQILDKVEAEMLQLRNTKGDAYE